MNAGRCRQTLEVLTPESVKDGRTTRLEWRSAGMARANVRPMTGRELWYAGAAQSEAKIVVELRGHARLSARSRLRDVQTRTVYEVVSMRPHDHRGIWQVADCREVGDGED